MKALRRMWNRVRGIFSGCRHEQDLADEITAHLAMQTEDNVRAGMDPGAARRAAVLKFGGVAGVQEGWRDQRGWPWIEALCADVRYAARGLRRNPGLTATVALTLALGIGANVAIFSVVYNVLLRPLPYPEAERLVRIYTTHEGRDRSSSSIPDYLDWKQRATGFEVMEGFRSDTLYLDGEQALHVPIVRGTPGLLDLIGARAALGRLPADDDMRADAPPVVVLTHAFWISRFGANPGIVGQPVRLGEARSVFSEGVIREEIDYAGYTVIGVAAPMEGPLLDPAQAIIPWIIETDPSRDLRTNWSLPIVARLRPGVGVDEAQAELDRIRVDLRAEQPEAGSPMARAVPLHEATVAEARPALVALLGATGLILLIAVSNIANILLARGHARRPELSMRAALGASRRRLARLLLTESVLLSLLGGMVGVVFGYVGVRVIVSLAPAWIPRLPEIALDGVSLAAALSVAAASGLLFGLAPVLFLRDVRMGRGRALDGEPQGVQGWLRSGLIVTQIALSFVLLTGSGLMIRSFLALQGVPIGIDYRQIVTFSLGGGIESFLVSSSGAGRVAQLQQHREVLEHVRTIPGVRGATLTSQAPLTSSSGGTSVVLLSGLRSGENHSPVSLIGVESDFFEFFDSAAMAGRLFTAADAAQADSVVVVDSAMAAIIWPDEPAVGQHIRFFGSESEVIGVVEPIRYGDLAQEIRPRLYHLLGRGGIHGSTVLVRHDGTPEPIMAQIEARLNEAEVDDALLPRDMQPLASLYDQYLREPRFYLWLLSGLGFLGLAVAVVGVYGVVAYSVTRRTGEIGIRMALGARRRQIAGLFCRRTFLMLVIGLGAGLIGSIWLTRYIESLLFQIEPADPVTLAAMAALLAAAAVTATWIPMRRALRVDPAATLRSE